MTMFGHKVFSEVIKLKEVVQVHPGPTRLVSLQEEGSRTQTRTGTTMGGHGQKLASTRQAERSQEKPACSSLDLRLPASRTKRTEVHDGEAAGLWDLVTVATGTHTDPGPSQRLPHTSILTSHEDDDGGSHNVAVPLSPAPWPSHPHSS